MSKVKLLKISKFPCNFQSEGFHFVSILPHLGRRTDATIYYVDKYSFYSQFRFINDALLRAINYRVIQIKSSFNSDQLMNWKSFESLLVCQLKVFNLKFNYDNQSLLEFLNS